MNAPDIDRASEFANWHDTGCELWSSCLSCPFPRCIEEEPHGRQKYELLKRAMLIKTMRDEGKSIREISSAVHKSIRTIQRTLNREAGGTRDD